MERIKYEKGGREGWHKYCVKLPHVWNEAIHARTALNQYLLEHGSGRYMLYNTSACWSVIFIENEDDLDRVSFGIMMQSSATLVKDGKGLHGRFRC